MRFETLEGHHKISKKQLRELAPELRIELLNTQFDLRRKDFMVLVILGGDDPAGCEEVSDRLHEWMDARHMDTRVFLTPADEERSMPRFWRYWRALPAAGQIGLHLGGWTTRAIMERASGEIGEREFGKRLEDIRALERTLVDDGALLIKFWLHLSKREHRKRLRKARKDPGYQYYVDDQSWTVYEKFDKAVPLAERAIQDTGTAGAPWVVVDASDREYRDVTVARALLEAIRRRMRRRPPARRLRLDPVEGAALSDVNLRSRLSRPKYHARLEKGQARLSRLARKAFRSGMSSVLVFEGWDAAGKGGCIRRLTQAISAREHLIVPVSAPTDEERAHHYLWRFWRRLPRAGRMVIFDRSWYGRVLVERVEGLAREQEWRRAYREIVEFEMQLADHGIPVLKFWLHIDPDEQLKRFRAREKTPYKKYKITDEDYRNRGRWPDYVAAINEMVARTSRGSAPWHLVPANDKRFARIMVLEAVCDALAGALH